MATFTLTGTFAHQDAATTPIVNTKISIAADPYPLSTKLLALGKVVATDASGQISVPLTTGVAGLYYVVRSLAKNQVFKPIRFLAPASGTVDITSLVFYNPGTPPLEQDLINIRDAALAAVAAVKIGTWQAATVYVSGQTVQAPDGSLIKSNSSRTSGAMFDATEAGNWRPVGPSVNLRDQPGVVGDGVADDAAALNTAIASAAAFGVRAFARGSFKIASTVTIGGNVDLSDATFNYTGTTVAVSVGSTTSGTVVNRLNVKLPHVVFTNKPTTGWTSGTIGVRLANLFSSEVHVGRISGFEDGLLFFGTGTGCVYNNVILQHLDNNKRNMRFSADATGWANQNTVVGGRCSHNSGEGAQVAGTRHVMLDTLANVPNNNTFVGVSLESPNVVDYHIDCYGVDNVWTACRFENTTTANTRVLWRANTSGNLITYGFGSQNIAETIEAGNTANTVEHKWQRRLFGSGASWACLVLENNAGNTQPVTRVMEAGAYAAGTAPATGYAWEWQAQKLLGKRSGDANPRISVDALNGRTWFGAGTSALAAWVGGVGSVIGWDGANFAPNADNTLDIGITSLRVRYLRTGTGVQVGRFATGSRPAAATAGAGTMIVDSTLNKPEWSDGTNWRDATGTIMP